MLEYYISMSAHLNLPSLSARSEDRHVRSTENFSRFTRRIRQWIVIPICECVCCGREGGRKGGREGGRRKGKGGRKYGRKGRDSQQSGIMIIPVLPLASPSCTSGGLVLVHRELESLVGLTCTLSSGAFTGLSLMFLVRMNPLSPFSSLVLTPIL